MKEDYTKIICSCCGKLVDGTDITYDNGEYDMTRCGECRGELEQLKRENGVEVKPDTNTEKDKLKEEIGEELYSKLTEEQRKLIIDLSGIIEVKGVVDIQGLMDNVRGRKVDTNIEDWRLELKLKMLEWHAKLNELEETSDMLFQVKSDELTEFEISIENFIQSLLEQSQFTKEELEDILSFLKYGTNDLDEDDPKRLEALRNKLTSLIK